MYLHSCYFSHWWGSHQTVHKDILTSLYAYLKHISKKNLTISMWLLKLMQLMSLWLCYAACMLGYNPGVAPLLCMEVLDLNLENGWPKCRWVIFTSFLKKWSVCPCHNSKKKKEICYYQLDCCLFVKWDR